jgi:hypothetical protein
MCLKATLNSVRDSSEPLRKNTFCNDARLETDLQWKFNQRFVALARNTKADLKTIDGDMQHGIRTSMTGCCPTMQHAQSIVD